MFPAPTKSSGVWRSRNCNLAEAEARGGLNYSRQFSPGSGAARSWRPLGRAAISELR